MDRRSSGMEARTADRQDSVESTTNDRFAYGPRAAHVVAMVLLSLVLAGPALSAEDNERPVASFTFTPQSPVSGEAVTFTSTSSDADGQIVAQAWDLDDDDDFDDGTGATATRTFDAAGSYTVRLRVVDDDGEPRRTSRTITVSSNAAPVAVFSASPASPQTGQTFVLTSTSTDPDGRPLVEEWDLDNDGAFDDDTGPQASTSFADDGLRRISLRVTDSGGAVRTTFRDITVRNRVPSASFGYAPTGPLTGDEVVLRSTSTDPDGTVAEHHWDLDGDGAFDDAAGAEVRTIFTQPGSHIVALQVRDDDGALSAAAFNSIDVAARPAVSTTGTIAPTAGPVAAKPGPTAPRLLDPFPRVRIRGVTTATGARLDVLSVRVRGGTRILVRCKGRGCPWRRNVQSARFSANLVRVIRVPGFKRRNLRAGTVIEVFVTDEGMIGKYTRFKIRRLKAPKRIDRCTAPGLARAQECPAP
jgi:PKD repeat protein